VVDFKFIGLKDSVIIVYIDWVMEIIAYNRNNVFNGILDFALNKKTRKAIAEKTFRSDV
jgi:hypothetical protein